MTEPKKKKKASTRKKKEVPEVELPARPDPQVFKMVRNHDETGRSGTGTVLEGIVFSDGICIVRWHGATPSEGRFESFEQFKSVHIDPHPTNETEIIWIKH